MRRASTLAVVAVLAGGAGGAGWSTAAAQARAPGAQPLDRVVAVVGARGILLSEVLEEVNSLRAQGQPMPSDSAGQVALMLRIINDLVDNEVVIAVAKQYKATATDEDVSKQVDDRYNQAKARFKSDAEFRDALRTEGFGTAEDYRRTLREQAKRYRMQQLGYDSLKAHGRLSAPVQVTEAEVSAAFEAARGRLPKRPATVAFRQIVIAPRAAPAARAVALAKAESLLVEVRGSADFATVARRESMDPTTKDVGGDLGWTRRGFMVPEFERAIFDPRVVPGQVLPFVVETTFGFHVIKVDRVQPAEVKSRHILVTAKLDTADVDRARLLGDSVRTRWQSGTPYDSLAARYHDAAEEKSIPEGIPVDSLPESYKAAIDGVPARGFTRPFDIPDVRTGLVKIGIMQVLERTEGGDFTVADYKDRIRTQLTEEKRIRRVLDQLRREQYVRIMLDEPALPVAKKAP